MDRRRFLHTTAAASFGTTLLAQTGAALTNARPRIACIGWSASNTRLLTAIGRAAEVVALQSADQANDPAQAAELYRRFPHSQRVSDVRALEGTAIDGVLLGRFEPAAVAWACDQGIPVFAPYLIQPAAWAWIAQRVDQFDARSLIVPEHAWCLDPLGQGLTELADRLGPIELVRMVLPFDRQQMDASRVLGLLTKLADVVTLPTTGWVGANSKDSTGWRRGVLGAIPFQVEWSGAWGSGLHAQAAGLAIYAANGTAWIGETSFRFFGRTGAVWVENAARCLPAGATAQRLAVEFVQSLATGTAASPSNRFSPDWARAVWTTTQSCLGR